MKPNESSEVIGDAEQCKSVITN